MSALRKLGIAALLGFPFIASSAAELDSRNIENGWGITDEGYCDQPYVVVLPDGAWLCTLTTGPGEEGSQQQHVAATRSTDKGKTWSPLVDIEAHGPPESSWVMPLLTDFGRVYAFYLFNADNLREVITSNGHVTKRVDTLGHYVYRYSDDGGLSWSDRSEIPIREFAIDRENPYGGKVRFFWGVGKPLAHNGVAWIGLSKVGRFGEGFIARSEGFFLKSDNILAEHDPAKLHWETLPTGDTGLRAPLGPIAEEQNITWLDSGALYCTYRTTEGHPCHAYSSDGGSTWTAPEYMSYTPGGRLFKHPRAANFVRRLSNGRFLYWFHNHGGTTYQGRNPVWLSAGREIDGQLHWSQPEILLYADDPELRMSYPDFIETKDGLYITETQKSVARVHAVDPLLLQGLFEQDTFSGLAKTGLLADYPQAPGGATDISAAPRAEAPTGLTIECTLDLSLTPSPRALLQILEQSGAPLLVAEAGEHDSLLLRGPWDESSGAQFETPPATLSPDKRQHLVIMLDYRAHILSILLDGILFDGGEEAPQGWFRLPAQMSFPGFPTAISLPEKAGPIGMLRVYDRCLSTSEAVGNYHNFTANP